MKLAKQDFNHRVYEEKTITLHPNNTAIYNNTKYKIKPVSPQDEYVEMEEFKCAKCGSLDANYVNEPYQEEINDVIEKVMLCKNCYKEAEQEI